MILLIILAIPCIVSARRYNLYEDRTHSLATVLCGDGFILSALASVAVMISFSLNVAEETFDIVQLLLGGFLIAFVTVIGALAMLIVPLGILLIYTCITVCATDNYDKSDKYKWILILVCLLIQAVFPLAIYFIFR